MEISFTGIRNLQIAKSRQIKNKIGLYPSSSGKIKQGELGICEYKIRIYYYNNFNSIALLIYCSHSAINGL